RKVFIFHFSLAYFHQQRLKGPFPYFWETPCDLISEKRRMLFLGCLYFPRWWVQELDRRTQPSLCHYSVGHGLCTDRMVSS
ncbi:mCG144776, partial [Mus musculus]